MEEKITAWVARDEDGVIALFTNKPEKAQHWWVHPSFGLGNVNKIPEKSFPQVKWEDKEPTKVELTIKICNCDGEETPEHQFKPFDKVLVRDSNNDNWICAIFSHTRYILSRLYVRSTNGYNLQCIPYEGNEHLVGTTDKPKED